MAALPGPAASRPGLTARASSVAGSGAPGRVGVVVRQVVCDQFDGAVVTSAEPVARQVEPGVVLGAEQYEVGEFGDPAEGPVVEVVSVAPLSGGVTTGVLAVPVTDEQGAAHAGGDDPGLPTDVERLTGSIGDHSGDHRVAANAAGQLTRYWPGPGQTGAGRPIESGVPAPG